ncbi:MAG: YybH family protein [Steroidobacteraceae bacterium]
MRASYPLLAALSVGLASMACGAAANPAAEIVAAMQNSAAQWNRGDIAEFAHSYKNSPDILFIGRSVSHGYAQMLAAYRRHYANRAQMGRLSFSHLAVQPLDEQFATVTGNYHLRRGKAGGGDSDGYFLLVFEKTALGWKIVRDDSTALPRSGPCATGH